MILIELRRSICSEHESMSHFIAKSRRTIDEKRSCSSTNVVLLIVSRKQTEKEREREMDHNVNE